MTKTNIVIAGGGFAGIYALKELQKYNKKRKNLNLTLVSDKNYFLFTPLLHEVATGSVAETHAIHPLRVIAGRHINQIITERAGHVHLKERRLDLMNGESLDYDYLILALGAKTAYFNTPGTVNFTYEVKDLNESNNLRNHLVNLIENYAQDRDKSKQNIVIVGGGPTGVEVATEIQAMLRDLDKKIYKLDLNEVFNIHIIVADDRILHKFEPDLSKRATRILSKQNIRSLTNTRIKEVRKDGVVTDKNKFIKAKCVVWCAGVEANSIDTTPPVERLPSKQILVESTLQLTGYPNVFVGGDLACIRDRKLFYPQTAQAAIQTGRYAAKAVIKKIENRPITPFKYKHKGNLVSLGLGEAAGDVANRTVSGFHIWVFWRITYLHKLVGWGNKFRVAVDWVLDFFYPRNISKVR